MKTVCSFPESDSGAAAIEGVNFSRTALHGDEDRAAAHGTVLYVFVISRGSVDLGGKTFSTPRAVYEGFLNEMHGVALK